MNIAMIGTGGIARRHLGVLSAEPEVVIVGHVSPTPEHAAAAAQRWGGHAYTTVADLLQHERVAAAWICVPPSAHGAIEQQLVERGIPFFVEKPLAADWSTAEWLDRTVAASGVVAAVGYHWRALDTIPELRQTLAIHLPRMVLGAWHDATPPPIWWRQQATSGGQMVEQATHLFDIARLLVGEAEVLAAHASHHPRPAYPNTDVDDVSAALLRFQNGATGVFSATCLLASTAAVQVQFVCDGLLVTLTQQSVVYDTGRERREVRARSDPFVAENRAFLRAVQQHDPTLLFSSYADALRTHHLCCDVLAARRDLGHFDEKAS